MTCIAGLSIDNRVWIGGDSAATGPNELTIRADPKVFRLGQAVIGYTSSYRFGQLLRYRLDPPDCPDDDVHRYLCTKFVDAVRACLRDGGAARRDAEVESGGAFLLGYRGKLWTIQADYQVGESLAGYDAVGSGADVARGALFASKGKDPADRIAEALAAAEAWTPYVRRPFEILEC
jgi:hypothetical protein